MHLQPHFLQSLQKSELFAYFFAGKCVSRCVSAAHPLGFSATEVCGSFAKFKFFIQKFSTHIPRLFACATRRGDIECNESTQIHTHIRVSVTFCLRKCERNLACWQLQQALLVVVCAKHISQIRFHGYLVCCAVFVNSLLEAMVGLQPPRHFLHILTTMCEN